MDEDLEQKILKKVYAWLAVVVIGMGSGTALLGPRVIRDDPFTGEDGRILEQKMTFHCEKMELAIRKDMPPLCTRKRILTIEKFLDQNFPEFVRTEFCW